MKNKIRTVELFAGVGGFRLGLEGWKGKSATSGYSKKLSSNYDVVWSNQWEPSAKIQHASSVYESRFGKKNHHNGDIAQVDISSIPEHDLLVGGFPCQDYSVATTLKNSKGLIGKKGVLWWSIHRILSESKIKPKYLFLENVDRLLISPSKQRGRDFAIILQSLNHLGYAVEWRVINAADYGMPQRRKRVFFIAYSSETSIFKSLSNFGPYEWITNHGTLAEAFPLTAESNLFPKQFNLTGDIVSISENFNIEGKTGPFQNSGVMINGLVTTIKTQPLYEGNSILLKDIIEKDEIESEFYIDDKNLDKWLYLKGSKKETRTNAQGFKYNYSEGGMIFPDPLDKPSRTIITGEGGKSPSRFKHVIQSSLGFRRLSPVELERLNMFPDNHTKLDGISNSKRAFFMGNALVVGVIEKIGLALSKKIHNEP